MIHLLHFYSALETPLLLTEFYKRDEIFCPYLFFIN